MELKIVFIGPELNSENLPVDILSRIRFEKKNIISHRKILIILENFHRMCRTCRQMCRAVKFDFQCGKLYHSYCKSSKYTKPDLSESFLN